MPALSTRRSQSRDTREPMDVKFQKAPIWIELAREDLKATAAPVSHKTIIRLKKYITRVMWAVFTIILL